MAPERSSGRTMSGVIRRFMKWAFRFEWPERYADMRTSSHKTTATAHVRMFQSYGVDSELVRT